MAPFNRPHTTVYWSTIVNVALSGTVFELFDIERYHDLEIWVRGHSRSYKPVPFDSLGVVSYSPSIVTMTLSCIICEILVENRDFFNLPLHSTPPLGGSRLNIAIPFGVEKLKWWGYPTVKKLWGCV